MKQLFYVLFIGLIFISCGSSNPKKRGNYSFKQEKVVPKPENITTEERTEEAEEWVVPKPEDADVNVTSKMDVILETAKLYKGTPYRYGGTTSKGMDCSGLMHTAFKAGGINLPRTSRDIATKGKKINFQQISTGDLVFFKTNRSRTINHVGLVVEVFAGKIFFIHSSTSQGVIISSLDEAYWFSSYVEARRVL